MNSKLPKTLFIVFAVVGIYYVVMRSVEVGFTHDESITYTMAKGEKGWLLTANNHWLNTASSFLFARVFGYSEWALRLPNVLAYFLFVGFVYRVFVESEKGNKLSFVLTPFLILNPYLIQYFSLCRGYGLGIAFFTGFLYFFQKLIKSSRKGIQWFVILGLLSIYSNYSFIIPVTSFMLVLVFRFLRDKCLRANSWYILGFALCLVPAVVNINYLSSNGHLMFGGEDNVISSSLISVFDNIFTGRYHGAHYYTLFAFFMISLYSLFFRGRKGIQFYFSLAILLLLLIPIFSFYTLEIKFAKERAALYWIVIISIVFKFYIDKLRKLNFRALIILVISVVSLLGFIERWNFNYLDENKVEADVPQMLEDLNNKYSTANNKYTMSIDWIFEPTINYYRETKQYHWLAPVTRKSINNKADFFYFKGDTKGPNCSNILNDFSQSNTRLYSNCVLEMN